MKEMYFQSFSHSESLQNVPIPISVWYRINSEFPRSSCRRFLPSSLCNLVQDERQLSLTKTWTIPMSTDFDDLWSSCYETPLCSPPAPVSWHLSPKTHPCLPDSRVCDLSVFLSPHLRILDWISACIPHQFPDTNLNTDLILFGIPLVDGIAEILRRVFLASNGLCNTRFMGLDFDIAGLVGSGFAIGEPSLDVASCLLFAMALCFLIGSESKLLKSLQENIEKLKMLNKRRRWFHSYRVKLPLVSMSTSWFSVSTYLVWIFRPKLTLSNHQSRATLWVLDTCLTVGLRPLMIILITASLSSRMYNWDSPWEESLFPETKLVGVLVLVLLREWSLVPHKLPGTNLPCGQNDYQPDFFILTSNYSPK